MLVDGGYVLFGREEQRCAFSLILVATLTS